MEALNNLNEKQLEAVKACDSHVRIIAGAGSGKTRVITTRIAYLIEELGILPYRILAITFTNKAANEMKNRVSTILNCEKTGVQISTIHSLCVRILREDIRYFEYPANFTILDSDDQKSILNQLYKKRELSPKDISYNSMLAYISTNKTGFVTPEQAYEMANKYANQKLMAEIYKEYEDKKKELYALDFDDLLIFTFHLFKENIEVRKKWQNRYDYIHVDEFQDVDEIQYGIVKYLVSDTCYLCVVGDPDQTIYTWRGASVDIILHMDKDFKGLKSIVLNENYRSTPSILKGANSLIQNNKMRIEKDLYTNNKQDSKIIHYNLLDEKNEAYTLANRILTLHDKKNVEYKDICVLYRSNYLSRNLEKTFLDKKIPYRIYGGIKFFERAEIKDSISYLRLLVKDFDAANELAIRRVINVPKRGIGKKAMETLETLASSTNMTYYDVLRNYAIAKGKAQKEVDGFVALLEKYRNPTDELSISVTLKHVLEESGYLKNLEDNREDERIENINELIHDIEVYEENDPEGTLADYLQMISLYTDNEASENEEKDYVQLMTIHAAKGTEFDYVFVYELCDGIFPNERSINEGGRHAMEEERRLAYVAFTRAKKELYLLNSSGLSYGGKIKTPSRFIKELDETVVKVINEKKEVSYANQEHRYIHDDILYPSQKSQVKEKGKKLKKGDLVEHTSFGSGVVINVKDGVVTIAFDHKYGIRKFAANHDSIQKK